MENESYWSNKFNALPYDTRNIAVAVSLYGKIRWLEIEKRHLKSIYDKSIKEINEHIKYMESEIKTEFKQGEENED